MQILAHTSRKLLAKLFLPQSKPLTLLLEKYHQHHCFAGWSCILNIICLCCSPGETLKAAVESIPDLHALAEFARQQLRKARTVNVSDIGAEDWNTIRAHAGM